MHKRTLAVAALTLVVAACAEGPVSPIPTPGITTAVASNVIQVPRDYATIQEAVDNAAAGNEILVRGAHDALVFISTAGIRVRAVAGASLVGSFIILADNVSIDGFRIESAYHNQGLQTFQVSGVEVKNNTFTSDGGPGDLRAIWLNECRNCSVKNNTVQPFPSDGISVIGDATGTEVRNNTVTGSAFGIYMWPGSTGAAVNNNAVSGYSGCGIVDASGTGTHTFKNNRTGCTAGF